MPMWGTLVLGAAAAALTSGAVLAQPNPEAAKRVNPVPSSAESLDAGKQIYGKHCSACHGADGSGGLGVSLVDDEWNHGSTDGEMFVVIQDGGGQFMEAWGDRYDETQIWHVVNYVRSLKAGAGK